MSCQDEIDVQGFMTAAGGHLEDKAKKPVTVAFIYRYDFALHRDVFSNDS